MNLIDIQPAVVGLLQADARFEGVPVIADDGTYPKTPGREAALAGPGLVPIVWEIESDGLVDAAKTGLAAHDVYTPVVIEENPTACRAESGVKIEAEKALQHVLEAVAGRPGGAARFVVMDPPFKNFGNVNGVRELVYTPPSDSGADRLETGGGRRVSQSLPNPPAIPRVPSFNSIGWLSLNTEHRSGMMTAMCAQTCEGEAVHEKRSACPSHDCHDCHGLSGIDA